MTLSAAKLQSLAAKEIHHLLPLVYALLAIDLLGLMDSFLNQSPDRLSWIDFSLFLNPKFSGYSSVFLGIGIIAAYMVFSQEREQRTLGFLWALPVRRIQVYMIKLGTAFVLLSSLGLIGSLLSYWVQSFGANTILQQQFSWATSCWELGLECALYAIGLSYGALISYYRIPGILFFLGLWVLILFLVQVRPELAFLSFNNLLTPEFRGSEILLATNAWLLQSTAAIVCLIIAGILWTKLSEPVLTNSRTSVNMPRSISLLAYVSVFVFILGYGATQLLPPGLLTDNVPEDRGLEAIETAQFEISYLQIDRGKAQLLAREADSLSAAVEKLLGASFYEKILVDLTDESTNHLGIAGWKRLRVGRTALTNPIERRHVFVHETVHVLADQIADRRLSEGGSHTKFFNEGIAEWVSYEILGIDETREALTLLAVTAWNRLDMRFSDLLFWSAFAARFDENLIYALGQVWVSTLAEVCGDQSPGNVLAAIGRPEAPQRLNGIRFWQDALQQANCDLSSVNSRFALTMKNLRPAADVVPVVSGTVALAADNIQFNLSMSASDPDKSYTVLVRIRDNPQSGPAGVFTRSAYIDSNGQADLTVPRAFISGERFQYQIGVEFLNNERPFYGRWIDAG